MGTSTVPVPSAPDRLIEEDLSKLMRMSAKCEEKFRDYKTRTNVLRWIVIVLGLLSTLRQPIEQVMKTGEIVPPVWSLFFAVVGGVTVLVAGVTATFRWEDKIAKAIKLKQKCESAHEELRDEWAIMQSEGGSRNPKAILDKLKTVLTEIRTAAAEIPINL